MVTNHKVKDGLAGTTRNFLHKELKCYITALRLYEGKLLVLCRLLQY